MFDILSKILNIKELRGKLLATLLLLMVFRAGIFIPVPGVNVEGVQSYMRDLSGVLGGVMDMADMFTGGGLSRFAIFGLGIMPYITASIIFQFLVAIVPALAAISKDGPSGRKKIAQYVRVSTVLLCIIHSFMICLSMTGGSGGQSLIMPGVSAGQFMFYGIFSLTAGTMFLMWLGEQIDEFGIGNGISIIIMAGILARLPHALNKLRGQIGAGGDSAIGPGTLAVLLILFVGMTLAVVMMTLGTRRIPYIQSKAIKGGVMVGGGDRQYLPLKVNQANVIPIIFAQAILQMVELVARSISPVHLAPMFSPSAFLYNLLYVGMIIFFCYFYTDLQFNHNEVADNLKAGGMQIKGYHPGLQTARYLKKIKTRIALAGGVFLAAVAVIPQVISNFMGVDHDISGMLGGTGLLIVVGVALDVVQRIESYLLARNYEGFGMAGGRIRGRRGY